jgi:hypothetical protein
LTIFQKGIPDVKNDTSIVAKISISVNTVVIHFFLKKLPKTRQFTGKSGTIPNDKLHTLKYRNVDFL